jgi:hypothetical protein
LFLKPRHGISKISPGKISSPVRIHLLRRTHAQNLIRPHGLPPFYFVRQRRARRCPLR